MRQLKRNKETQGVIMNKAVSVITAGMILCMSSAAFATQPHAARVDDHYKTVIVKIIVIY